MPPFPLCLLFPDPDDFLKTIPAGHNSLPVPAGVSLPRRAAHDGLIYLHVGEFFNDMREIFLYNKYASKEKRT